MKVGLVSCFCALACIIGAFAQTPTPPSDLSAPPTAPVAVSSPAAVPVSPAAASITPATAATALPLATVAPSLAPTPTPDTEEEIDRAIERQVRKVFSHESDGDHFGNDGDIPKAVLGIVLIGCLAVFGTPVFIVGLIMYFSFSKSRALHKTVRMMVEKGQPVPEALLNPPPVVRQRSDLRRGVVLLMIGIGVMVFFGAVNDWEGGSWSLGVIPFLIGAGYLLVWKLDVRKSDTSPRV